MHNVSAKVLILSKAKNRFSVKMPGRLVNEKTLELNITHEGMANLGIGGVFGFTQKQESRIGADVLFPYGKPFIIQFKAAREGADNSWAKFRVNNNKRKNQHRVLDVIARSGLCDAHYAFPLIVSDAFLASNFGSLLNFTCMIDASRLTRNLNWINQAHSVIVQQNCSFTVRSSKEVKGKGVSANQFFKQIKERERKPDEETKLSDFVRDLVKRLDQTVQESEIHGQSEHTIVVIGTDSSTQRLGYLQLPIRIKGLQEKPKKEKISFT